MAQVLTCLLCLSAVTSSLSLNLVFVSLCKFTMCICCLRSGESNVMAVKACIRHSDHVVVVMPYFEHDRFQVRLHILFPAHLYKVVWTFLFALRTTDLANNLLA